MSPFLVCFINVYYKALGTVLLFVHFVFVYIICVFLYAIVFRIMRIKDIFIYMCVCIHTTHTGPSGYSKMTASDVSCLMQSFRQSKVNQTHNFPHGGGINECFMFECHFHFCVKTDNLEKHLTSTSFFGVSGSLQGKCPIPDLDILLYLFHLQQSKGGSIDSYQNPHVN